MPCSGPAKMGQGLVGTYARPPITQSSDAQSPPAFRYLPRRAKKIYLPSSAMPILRAGRSLVFLVVPDRRAALARREMERSRPGDGARRDYRHGQLKKIAKPALEVDLTLSSPSAGDSYNECIGLGYVVRHDSARRRHPTAPRGYDHESVHVRGAGIASPSRKFPDDMLSAP